eukprot:scaffold23554_cov18-Tisochrysis_lutea.AAC.1
MASRMLCLRFLLSLPLPSPSKAALRTNASVSSVRSISAPSSVRAAMAASRSLCAQENRGGRVEVRSAVAASRHLCVQDQQEAIRSVCAQGKQELTGKCGTAWHMQAAALFLFLHHESLLTARQHQIWPKRAWCRSAWDRAWCRSAWCKSAWYRRASVTIDGQRCMPGTHG